MPIKLQKYDIQNTINNPKEGYMILGFDLSGNLVCKDSNGYYRPIIDTIPTGYFDELSVLLSLTVGSRLTGSTYSNIGLYSITQGNDVIASGISSYAQGYETYAIGDYSTVRGEYVLANGKYAYASGKGMDIDNKLRSNGVNSFVHSYSNVPSGGTDADFSVVLGGQDNYISSGGTNSVIIGGTGNIIDTENTAIIVGNGITNTIDNAVYVPRLVLTDTASDDEISGIIQWSGNTGDRFEGWNGSTWVYLDSDSTSDITSLIAVISAESSNRLVGDLSLSSAISTETSVRISTDTSLSTQISTVDSSIVPLISTETSVRISTDQSISTQISVSDYSLSTAISSDGSTRLSTDNSLSGRIISGDLSISTDLSTEISYRKSGDISLSTEIIGGDNTTSLSISIETSTRIVEDGLKSGLITSEISTRSLSDSSLFIQLLSTDTSISTDLSTEISYRLSGDGVNSNAIFSEGTDRLADDRSLSTAIKNEITTRGNSDSILSTSIFNEGLSMGIGDSNLSTNISTERSIRISTDTSISTIIGNRSYTNNYVIGNSDTLTQSLNKLNMVFGPNNRDLSILTGYPNIIWEIISGRIFINGYSIITGLGWQTICYSADLYPNSAEYGFIGIKADGSEVKVMQVLKLSGAGYLQIYAPNGTYYFFISYVANYT